MSYLELMESWN